jgi:uncharacterized protein (DUF2225 family)
MAAAQEEEQLRISYFAKQTLSCPICKATVKKEELHSGAGRLIAGILTDELHRTYEPTKKYGLLYPLAYALPVCPKCHFSAFNSEWQASPKLKAGVNVKQILSRNYSLLKEILPELDFNRSRTLMEGVGSYVLALFAYELFEPEVVPVFKQALCSLRGAWLCNDLDHLQPNEGYRELAAILYRKASFYYRLTCELEEGDGSSFTKLRFLGPDQDNNFDFDGVLYLASLLEYKYGPRGVKEKRRLSLEASRTTISKVVGIGKASKNKPKDILDLSRNLYANIKEELASLDSGV